MKYTTVIHTNSKSATRQGLRNRLDRFGNTIIVDVFSAQVFRGGDEKLPHDYTPRIVRGFRSKYERHVGEKQLAKARR